MTDIPQLPDGAHIESPSSAQLAATVRDNALLRVSDAIRDGDAERAHQFMCIAEMAQRF